jgi:hypothetical protein
MLTGLSQREINPNNAAATIVQEMTAEGSNAADEDGNHEEEDDAHFEKISTLTLQIWTIFFLILIVTYINQQRLEEGHHIKNVKFNEYVRYGKAYFEKVTFEEVEKLEDEREKERKQKKRARRREKAQAARDNASEDVQSNSSAAGLSGRVGMHNQEQQDQEQQGDAVTNFINGWSAASAARLFL